MEMGLQGPKADIKLNMHTGIALNHHPSLRISDSLDIMATTWTATTRETTRIMKTVHKIELEEIAGIVDVMSNTNTNDTLRVFNFLNIDLLGNHPSIQIANLIDTAANSPI